MKLKAKFYKKDTLSLCAWKEHWSTSRVGQARCQFYILSENTAALDTLVRTLNAASLRLDPLVFAVTIKTDYNATFLLPNWRNLLLLLFLLLPLGA
jgi:hypothetical protein